MENREHAYQLITQLEDGVETYLSLTQPDQSDWAGEDKENAKLLKMFSVRQPFALLMAMRETIPTGFSQVLKSIVSITFRYNVISNLQAAEQERTYSRVAIGISRGIYATAAEVLAELRSIYPSDEVFRSNFATKTLDTSNSRNKQIVRYILAKLQAQETETAFHLPPPEVTIEHILPENPASNWPQFNDVTVTSEVYRLGNMTLLEKRLNNDASNLSYDDKKPIMSSSTITPTASIPTTFDVWDEASIENRQRTLANMATSIWRISQLH